MNIIGPFPGLVEAVAGTSPGPAPRYTIQVFDPAKKPQTFEGVRPQTFWWDQLAVDEDGAKMVGKVVTCYYMDRRLVADFVPPPLVGPCTGTESALLGALMSRLAALEAKIAAMEAA